MRDGSVWDLRATHSNVDMNVWKQLVCDGCCGSMVEGNEEVWNDLTLLEESVPRTVFVGTDTTAPNREDTADRLVGLDYLDDRDTEEHSLEEAMEGTSSLEASQVRAMVKNGQEKNSDAGNSEPAHAIQALEWSCSWTYSKGSLDDDDEWDGSSYGSDHRIWMAFSTKASQSTLATQSSSSNAQSGASNEVVYGEI